MIMKINWTYIACLSLTILTGCSGDDIFAPDHIWSAGKQGGLLVTNRDKKEIYLIDANFNKTGTKAVRCPFGCLRKGVFYRTVG